MKRILRKDAIHVEFGGDVKPELEVELGESFVIETNDNWWNLLEKDGTPPDVKAGPLAAVQYPRSNPIGGPVFIKGVEPGDTLVVEIQDISIRDWGWTGTLAGIGPIAGMSEWKEIDEAFSTVIRHVPGPSGSFRDGEAVMKLGKREVRWPLDPFIGVIVTAPERGIENTLTSQGPWGGNIDVREIAAGNKIHMNVGRKGGMFYAGDVHGSQADSEFTAIADETAADLTFKCDVIKNRITPGILRVEKPKSIVQVDGARNAGSMERALNSCFLNMMRWLVEDYNMSKREAYLHMTANSLVRCHVYQHTLGFFVCGVEFPKQCL